MASIQEVLTLAKQLTLQEQLALNKLLVANIRHANKMKSLEKAVTFRIGDLVKFDAKTRGIIVIKVTGFSRDMTKIKGVQQNVGRSIKARKGMNWTAGAGLVSAATEADVARY